MEETPQQGYEKDTPSFDIFIGENKNIQQEYFIEKAFEELEIFEEMSRQNIHAVL